MGDEYKNSGQVGALGEGAHSHGNTFIQNIYNNQSTYTALHQLPPPTVDFVGREKEMTELLQALENGGVTISGLQGMGGIGKTALALKLAEQLKPKYPDAQFYLDLKGASKEPLTSAQAMAHVIRAYHPEAKLPEDENSLRGLYLSLLDSKKALLLMDNAASAEQVKPLIPPAGSILLVTSRNHFTLSGFFVKHLDALEPKDAELLLLKIAPRIGDCANKIAELCGNLPLALEVAASALRLAVNLTPAVYIKRLEKVTKRLELIDASLKLSYDLLSIKMQRLWRSLAVFPNTFDDAAVAALWGMKIEDTQDRLAELISYSLIEWNETTRRYRLHDLVRIFADTRLRGQERFAAQRAHASYFRNLLAQAEGLYLKGGEEMRRGLALFDLEHEDIEVGQTWVASLNGKDEISTKLCMSYWNAGASILPLRLHPRINLTWLEAAYKAACSLEFKTGMGSALSNLGLIYSSLGDNSKAIEFYEQALKIDQELGDRNGEGTILGNLGIAYLNLQQIEKALSSFEQSLEIYQELGHIKGKAAILGNLGTVYFNLQDNVQAIHYFKQSLKIAREIEDSISEGNALNNLGGVYTELGKTRKALKFFELSLKIAREIGDHRGEGNTLWNCAWIYNQIEDRTQAISYAEKALTVYEQIEAPAASKVRLYLEQWKSEQA